jgi:PadR family transcriptional regulator, regulatory protein AphA
MSLRFALLGFLSTTPASGYTLGRKFADGAGAMWEALPSQIYLELQRLESLGLIAGETAKDDKLRRRLYRITEHGRAELKIWVESETADRQPERDAERVRFLFLDRSELPAIRRHVERLRAHYEQQLERWSRHRDGIADGTQERLVDRLADCPPRERDFVTAMKWFAFDGLVRRARMEAGWAEDILKWLETCRSKSDVATLPYETRPRESRRKATTRTDTAAPKRRGQAR